MRMKWKLAALIVLLLAVIGGTVLFGSPYAPVVGAYREIEELCEAGLDRKLHKYFPVLAGGDVAMGSEMMILRAVTRSGGMLVPARLPYDVLERTVGRILREAPLVSRVLYDETPTAVGKESFA